MVKNQRTQTMQMPTTLLELERKLSDKNFKNLSREVFGEGSSCRRVVRRKTDCKPDPSTMMTAIMCRVWYSPGGANPKELLVTTFRRVMKNEWAKYKSACPRPKSGKRRK